GRVFASAQIGSDSLASRDAPFPCSKEKEAQRYLKGRGIRIDSATHVLRDRPPFHLLFRSGAPLLDASGRVIALNRFGLRKYFKSSLSPLRIYTRFDVSGGITFTEIQSGCRMDIALSCFANEWSPWLLAEGDRAILESNGK